MYIKDRHGRSELMNSNVLPRQALDLPPHIFGRVEK